MRLLYNLLLVRIGKLGYTISLWKTHPKLKGIPFSTVLNDTLLFFEDSPTKQDIIIDFYLATNATSGSFPRPYLSLYYQRYTHLFQFIKALNHPNAPYFNDFYEYYILIKQLSDDLRDLHYDRQNNIETFLTSTSLTYLKPSLKLIKQDLTHRVFPHLPSNYRRIWNFYFYPILLVSYLYKYL